MAYRQPLKKIAEKGDGTLNTIFGEYHFYEGEKNLQQRVIAAVKPSIIYSEQLGDERITSLEDLDRLHKRPEFKKDPTTINGKKADHSNHHLLEWYHNHRIPIIGTGDLTTTTDEELEEMIQSREHTFSSVGRRHVWQLYELFDDASVIGSQYNGTSNFFDAYQP